MTEICALLRWHCHEVQGLPAALRCTHLSSTQSGQMMTQAVMLCCRHEQWVRQLSSLHAIMHNSAVIIKGNVLVGAYNHDVPELTAQLQQAVRGRWHPRARLRELPSWD